MTSELFSDCFLSPEKLAKRVGLGRLSIMCFMRRECDPLPHLIINGRYKVRWSDWCEWSIKNFGEGY